MRFIRAHLVLTVTVGTIAVFALSVFSGLFVLESRKTQCNYTFINQDIACGSPDIVKKTGYLETQERIIDFIEAMQTEDKVGEVAVYFRDLKHGPVFGVNELALFAPASLLKVPLAFVFLRSAEVQPELLAKKIQYTGTNTVAEQRIKPRQSAEPNQSYPIEELLRFMLSYSDNASYEILEQFLTDDPHRSQLRLETFQELGLINPRDRIEETITVRGYASLFRILYNVSYLNEELSEKMLRWLAESDYDQGIVTGVPIGVVVAHKFGERFDLPGNQKQLHDCGIVYYPQNPYLICIMTRGKDFQDLTAVISAISKMFYEEFNSRKL